MIILYTTGCPICELLKSHLDQAGIAYEICHDTNEMKRLGITHVPVLGVDGTLYDTREALAYAKEAMKHVC